MLIKDSQKLIEKIKSRDRVVKVLSLDGKFRASAIKNTNAAITAQESHNLPYPAAYILARTLASVSLMSSFLKGEERIQIEIESSGLVKYVFAEALQVGEQRGYITYDAGLTTKKIKSVSDILHLGLMKVVRILYNLNEPLVSIIDLKKGDIATDLAYYFAQSEQTPSAVILDTDFDKKGKITQSGGLIIQALPGAKKKDIEKVYEKLKDIKPITEYFNEGLTPDKVLKQILLFNFNIMSSTPVDFFCRCSKEGFMEKLLTLGSSEIEEMQASKKNELVCHYCNKKYELEDSDFAKIIEEIKAKKN